MLPRLVKPGWTPMGGPHQHELMAKNSDQMQQQRRWGQRGSEQGSPRGGHRAVSRGQGQCPPLLHSPNKSSGSKKGIASQSIFRGLLGERRVFGSQVGGSQEMLGDQASQSLPSAVDPSSLLHGSQVCGSVISSRNNGLLVQMPAACDRAEETPSTTEHLSGVTVLSLQSCPKLCDPVDCSSPGSSVHGILQARIPEWVPIPSFGGTS